MNNQSDFQTNEQFKHELAKASSFEVAFLVQRGVNQIYDRNYNKYANIISLPSFVSDLTSEVS